MPLYDISDEAGQTELLLKELEYAAQVIVDKLEQDGQLSAWLQSYAVQKLGQNPVICGNCRYNNVMLVLDVFCLIFVALGPHDTLFLWVSKLVYHVTVQRLCILWIKARVDLQRSVVMYSILHPFL